TYCHFFGDFTFCLTGANRSHNCSSVETTEKAIARALFLRKMRGSDHGRDRPDEGDLREKGGQQARKISHHSRLGCPIVWRNELFISTMVPIFCGKKSSFPPLRSIRFREQASRI